MQEIKTTPTVRHTTPLQLLAAFAATVAVLFVLLLGRARCRASRCWNMCMIQPKPSSRRGFTLNISALSCSRWITILIPSCCLKRPPWASRIP